MNGEAPRVEIIMIEDMDLCLNIVYVNGIELPHHQRSHSLAEATYLQHDLLGIVADAYRRGYQTGFAECRKAVREAIGAIGETK